MPLPVIESIGRVFLSARSSLQPSYCSALHELLCQLKVPPLSLLLPPHAPSPVSPISRAIRRKLWEVKWERPEQQQEELRQISSGVLEVETEVKAQARAIEEASK